MIEVYMSRVSILKVLCLRTFAVSFQGHMPDTGHVFAQGIKGN